MQTEETRRAQEKAEALEAKLGQAQADMAKLSEEVQVEVMGGVRRDSAHQIAVTRLQALLDEAQVAKLAAVHDAETLRQRLDDLECLLNEQRSKQVQDLRTLRAEAEEKEVALSVARDECAKQKEASVAAAFAHDAELQRARTQSEVAQAQIRDVCERQRVIEVQQAEARTRHAEHKLQQALAHAEEVKSALMHLRGETAFALDSDLPLLDAELQQTRQALQRSHHELKEKDDAVEEARAAATAAQQAQETLQQRFHSLESELVVCQTRHKESFARLQQEHAAEKRSEVDAQSSTFSTVLAGLDHLDGTLAWVALELAASKSPQSAHTSAASATRPSLASSPKRQIEPKIESSLANRQAPWTLQTELQEKKDSAMLLCEAGVDLTKGLLDMCSTLSDIVAAIADETESAHDDLAAVAVCSPHLMLFFW